MNEITKELLDALKTCVDYGSMTGAEWVKEKAVAAIAKTEAAMAEEKPDADGWIKWEGGKCPVDADTLVDCKLRDGYVERCQKASFFDWSDIDFDTDIIAYRIVKETQ